MDPKDWIAAYAAVVATGTAVWNVYCAVRRDAARLKVSASLGWLVTDAAGQRHLSTMKQHRGGALVLSLAVTNIGRRPITVSDFGGRYATGGKAYTIPQRGPRELKEYERTDMMADDATALLDRGVATMFVVDAADRKWHVSRSELKRLHREYARLKRERVEAGARSEQGQGKTSG